MGMFSNEEFRQLAPQVLDIGKYWTDICGRKGTDMGKYLWQQDIGKIFVSARRIFVCL